MSQPDGTIRLLINCPDARGIIATVANFVASHNGNILDADQHTDPHTCEFFMRLEIDPDGFDLSRERFADAWAEVANRYAMTWKLHWSGETKRMAIFVSREDHCLHDLLWRWRTRELRTELPLVISNHDDLRSLVESCGVRFEHVPNTPENREQAEAMMRSILADAYVDLIVLARYMQVLSLAFVASYPRQIINIHHSFLPAFAGSRPYHQAFERGVKIIGATSHYVTEDLDSGPIIAQSTIPVDHRDTIEDMIRKGRDLERLVLARAVRLHIEDRILVSKNKTVVFE
ncbi:MAG: formyltetrahydrofolate deformylase [Planctomycetes bacterium]|nr:formyltetrahydrofolate deformylase [Planctomycetota bacterium]